MWVRNGEKLWRLYYAVFGMDRLVSSEEFINFIMAIIFVNSVFMSLEHHNQPQGLTDFLAVSNVFFAITFTLEASMRHLLYYYVPLLY